MNNIDISSITFEAGLYLAATPLGNMSDITLRVLAALDRAQLILAEDTRRTRKILSHYAVGAAGAGARGAGASLQSCHEHSEISQRLMERIKQIIERGGCVVFVSDAGTPLISDPGFALVRAARALALPIFSLPGPSAITAALSVAALPCHRFSFGGFLPNKTIARKNYLRTFEDKGGSLVFFESPMRVLASLKDMAEVFGAERLTLLAREMTKKFEEVRLDSLQGLIEFYGTKKMKGEITLVVAPEAARRPKQQ